MHFAENSVGFSFIFLIAFGLMTLQLFIDIATILATCNIERAIDSQGSPIIPVAEYIKQFIRQVTK